MICPFFPRWVRCFLVPWKGKTKTTPNQCSLGGGVCRSLCSNANVSSQVSSHASQRSVWPRWVDGGESPPIFVCEELVECGTGSFIHMKVQWDVSDLIRLDLQNALDRYIPTLHLPVKRLKDNQVMLQVFVPQGCTCYSSAPFACLSEFQHWQATLLSAGSRAYLPRPGGKHHAFFTKPHHVGFS